MSEREIKSKEDHSLVEVANEMMLSLNEKEKRALSGRVGFSGKKETLSAIGRELNLSRERIRQIEKNSLKKLAEMFAKEHSAIIADLEKRMKENGGLVSDDNLPENLLAMAEGQKFAKSYVRLACTISPIVEKIDENNDLKNGWVLSEIKKDKIVEVCNKIIKYLKGENIPCDLATIKKGAELTAMDDKFILACIDLSNKIVMAKNGLIGLKSWPTVNPKNVRDKIYFVLKTAGQPLHFTEITSRIADYNFDGKKVVRATVHNELIADNRFVLIGRGIYALREWGFSDGTVYEVIKNILDHAKSPMSVSEIIELVNKSRKVKRNTIVINLQTKKEFKKVNGGYIFQGLAK